VTSLGTDLADGRFLADGERAEASVIVVTYNSAADIGLLLDDLRASARLHALRVVVVDNQSSDDTAAVVSQYPDAILVESGGNLGYAGGINRALPRTGSCGSVLILNPDLRLQPGAIGRMLETLASDDRVGVVVPRILDHDGQTYPSLRFEPSTMGVIGDSLFGRTLWRGRPCFLSEFDYRRGSYRHAHQVDWATGAAMLIRGELARRLGGWDERFFLYSEETEYFRRVRDSGCVARYEPTAVVEHRLGGSGTSPALAALMAVNRVRYVEMHHGRAYSVMFRAAVALGEVLRSYDGTHRRTLAVVLSRRKWSELPKAPKPTAS
jgi:GT2 family glycosyltransferase